VSQQNGIIQKFSQISISVQWTILTAIAGSIFYLGFYLGDIRQSKDELILLKENEVIQDSLIRIKSSLFIPKIEADSSANSN
jgi:hypothetical protein